MRGIIVGQKTHPMGFRLITTQKHLSSGYSAKASYSTRIAEDFFIRKKICEVYKDTLALSKIEINRAESDLKTSARVNIVISALFPRTKEISKNALKFFNKNTTTPLQLNSGNSTPLKDNLKYYVGLLLKQKKQHIIRACETKFAQKLNISFKFIHNQFEDAALITQYISEQLERRVPYRRAIKQAIRKIQFTSIKGLKIQVGGRLNGIDIARTEWKREGKLPLHTLTAKIDYAHHQANTIYGIIGIKAWLFI